jgi:predicted RNA-binding Zn-ribbon protein involved in translation (DUF1610 family)
MEDCEALKTVTDFIYAHGSTRMPTLSPQSQNGIGPIVVPVEEIDRLGTVKQRGRREFFNADFAHINDCARFDYQRQRVYVRLGKRRRKANCKKERQFDNLKLRVTHRITITSRKCPFCGSNEIARPTKAHFGKGCFTKAAGKRAFDLICSSNGIKRKIIECKASVHHCLKCDKPFVPERYQRLAKHYHGLMSWAMYEHVAHRTSASIVSKMFEDFFGLVVDDAEVMSRSPRFRLLFRLRLD